MMVDTCVHMHNVKEEPSGFSFVACLARVQAPSRRLWSGGCFQDLPALIAALEPACVSEKPRRGAMVNGALRQEKVLEKSCKCVNLPPNLSSPALRHPPLSTYQSGLKTVHEMMAPVQFHSGKLRESPSPTPHFEEA